MRWLIKLLGGYTAKEYEKVVKRANEWNEIERVHYDPCLNSAKVIVKEPIHRAIFELKTSIEKKEYSNISRAIFSISDELKLLLHNYDELSDAHELLNKIQEVKISLQNSKVERMEKYMEEQGETINKSFTILKSHEEYSKLSLWTNNLVMSTRAHNALKRAGYNIIGELVVLGIEELSKLNNIGEKSLDEIITAMKEMGVEFDMQLPEEIVNAIKDYTSAKRNINYSPMDESLKGVIFEGEPILPSPVFFGRNGDIVKPS
jgi:hypothetical protein